MLARGVSRLLRATALKQIGSVTCSTSYSLSLSHTLPSIVRYASTPSFTATSPIIAENKVKRALAQGGGVCGLMLAEIRQPSIMQLFANSGFDFVIIDNEHGPFNIETIADLTRAARYAGVTPIVRIPDLHYAHIAQSLDSGAQGLMFPRITDAQQVREIIAMSRFPPLGRRGNALARGYTQFKGGNVMQAMAANNQETLLVVQVETKEAIDNIESIAAEDGVDVLLIGPNDLSIALGVGGDQNGPVMQTAIKKVIAACHKHGVTPAIHINDLNLAKFWAQQGMKLVSYNSECGLLVGAGQQVSGTLKDAFKTK